jgi:hypothetical protein
MKENCSLLLSSRCTIFCKLSDGQKKLSKYREKANRLYFESNWSKDRISQELHMSKHFVVRWTQSPGQDFSKDGRGWPKGQRRKWTETTEQRIREIHENQLSDPEEFFFGATAIQHHWRKKYTDIPPPLRTIGQILTDLHLSNPRKKRRNKGAAKYLLYPEKTIYGGQLGNRVLESDFIQRFLKGRSSPLHFIGYSAKKAPRIRYFIRIAGQTADAFVNACETFFDRFEQPDVMKVDNAATFIGSVSGKRNLSKTMLYLLNRGISPVFAVPRRPFTQASVEGNNSVFARNFWNRRTFENLADVDRQLQWFNESSLRYTAYEKPKPATSKSTKTRKPVTNIYFLRQIMESSVNPGQGSISVLNEEILLPAEWINFFVLAKWNLKTETLSVFIEQKDQLQTLSESQFLINKTTKQKLTKNGALSSCI